MTIQDPRGYLQQFGSAKTAIELEKAARPRDVAGTTGESFEAGFFRQNLLASLGQHLAQPEFPETEGYNAFTVDGDFIDRDYPDESDAFRESNSTLETMAIANRIDQERNDLSLIADNGVAGGFGQLLGAALSPEIMIPFGGGVSAGVRGFSALSRLAMAGRVTAISTGTVALSEAGLQATQVTRTEEESETAVLFAGVLGLVLGGASAALAKDIRGPLVRLVEGPSDEAVETLLRKSGQTAADIINDSDEAVRLDWINRLAKEDPDTAKLARIGVLGKVLGAAIRTPIMRLARSPFKTARVVGQILGSTPLVREGTFTRPAVEAFVWRHHANASLLRRHISEVFTAHKKNGGQFVKRDAFHFEVSKALRRSDVHGTPEVQELAQTLRKFFDRFKNEALDLGILQKVDLKDTAESWLFRIYDMDAINKNPGGFRDVLIAWLEDSGTLRKQKSGDVADQIIRNLKNSPQRRMPYELRQADSFRERLILAKDVDLEPYLVHDLDTILHRFTQQWAADVELTRAGRITPTVKMKTTAGRIQSALSAEGTSAAEARILASNVEDLFAAQHLARTPGKLKKSQETLSLSTRREELDFQIQQLNQQVDVSTRIQFKLGPGSKVRVKGKTPGELTEVIDLAKEERKVIMEDLKDARQAAERKRIPDDLELDEPSAVETLLKELEVDISEMRRLEALDGLAFKSHTDAILQEGEDAITAAKGNRAKVTLAGKRQADAVADVNAMIMRIQGVYGQAEDPASWAFSVANIVRKVNFMRFMGSVVPASIPDLAMPIFTQGLRGWARGLMLVMRNPSLRQAISKGDISDAVRALELWSVTRRSYQVADLIEDAGGLGVIGKTVDLATSFGEKLFGINYWNGALKGWSSVIISDKILGLSEKLAKGGKLSASQLTNLKLSGISPTMAKKIFKQWTKAGADASDGMKLSKSTTWENQEVARVFEAAVIQDTNRTIITPGAGDTPRFMGRPLLGLLGQFRSFAFTASQHVLFSGLQRRDAAVLHGTIGLLTLGAFSYAGRAWLANRVLSDNPRTWIVEAVDRSGVLGHFMEVNGLTEVVSQGRLGINPMLGGDITSRFSNRTVLETVSPAAGLIEDTFHVADPLFRDRDKNFFGRERISINPGDIKRWRRLMWYQNWWGWRKMLTTYQKSWEESVKK